LQVREVYNWPPGIDGVGNVQNWCFLTVEGEYSKIKRASDLLNNTIWKGSKLRIGLAKEEAWMEEKSAKVVDDEAELEQEKVKKEKKEKKEKKKTSKRIESEKVAQPVTTADVEEGVWVSQRTETMAAETMH